MDVTASLLDIIIIIIFIIVVFSYVKFLRIGSCGLGYYKDLAYIIDLSLGPSLVSTVIKYTRVVKNVKI